MRVDMKAWLNGTLLVRMVKPIAANYNESGMKRGLAGLGRLIQQSGVYRNIARVAAKGFYTETSVFYRVLSKLRRGMDKCADGLHQAFAKPAANSGIVRLCQSTFRTVTASAYAAAGAVLIGFGAGYGGVSLALGLAGPRRLAAAGAAVLLGAALIALRSYLHKHAKDSAVVRLFLYLVKTDGDKDAADEKGVTV